MDPARPFVVWCAGVHWDALRGTDRHLVTALSAHADVLWVDPPLSVVRKFRPSPHGQQNEGRGLRRVADGIIRLTVLVPPYSSRPVVRVLAAGLLRRAVRRAVRRLAVTGGHRPVTALVNSAPEPVFRALPDAPHVYFATDDFTQGASLLGLPEDSLARLEAGLAADSDLLVGVTDAIVQRWPELDARRLVLPNGCVLPDDVSAMPPSALGLRLPAPLATVVGQFSHRIDLDLLSAVADEGISLLLVGPHDPSYRPAEFRALVARSQVAWVDQQPYEKVAGYLRATHVGLTPYVDSAFNRSSFPLKTLEYLAAGRAVVSSPLPAVDELDTDQISTAATPREFARAVADRLAEPLTPELVGRRRTLAAANSWDARAVRLLAEMVALTQPGAAPRPGGATTRIGNESTGVPPRSRVTRRPIL